VPGRTLIANPLCGCIVCEVVLRAVGLPIRLGGEQHTGWLPAGAAIPLPTPIRDLIFDFEIQYDGSGYLLCYSSQDESVFGDTWHETLPEARAAALEQFGVLPEHWRAAK
jgi:hypothetical protein